MLINLAGQICRRGLIARRVGMSARLLPGAGMEGVSSGAFGEVVAMPRMEGKANIPGSHFRKIMALRPDIAKSWNALDEAMRFNGVLHPGLKEEVRRMVAQHSGCAFCASLGAPIGSYDDPRLAAAVAYGQAVAKNPTGVDDATWNELQRHFSEEEIVELTAWIAFMFASEMIGGIMKLEPASPELLAMYTKWIAGGIARHSAAAE